jgi:hypothetical protein
MAGLHIRCESCGRSWRLEVASSLFMELNVLGQPCPWCEAYTLQCSADADVAGPVDRHRSHLGTGRPPGSALLNAPGGREPEQTRHVAAARRRLPLSR